MILPEVRREERARFAYALAAFMCVASAALIARTIGDTIYLTRFGSSRLSLMYIGTAVVIAALSFAYARFVSHWPIARAIAAVSALLVVGCAAIRFGLTTPSGSLRVVTYYFAELIIRLPALLFWTYVAIIFNPREAKRIVGLIGAGGTLACIGAGAAIPAFARLWGTANLLWLVAGLVALFALLVLRSGVESARTAGHGDAGATGLHYYTALLKRDQVRDLAGLVALAAFALIVNDFVFKSAARAHYTGHELAAFFGGFYSTASIAALLLQLFVVHQVLARGGLGTALRILPAALLVASAGVILTGSFAAIIAAKFVEPFLDFTINIAAVQMLYLGIAKQSRQRVRAFIDGIARPFAVAVAGATILAARGRLSPASLEAIVAVACCAWIWLAKRNHAAYTRGLSESIGARRLDLTGDPNALVDPAVLDHVRGALRNAADADVPYILTMLANWTEIDWTPEYRMLLERPSGDVKVAALEFLAAHGDATDVDAVAREAGNPDARVREAAVHALASLSGAERAPLLWECVRHDDDARVRTAAAAELMRHGDLDDLIAAATAFRAMIVSPDPRERIAAVQAVALVGHGSSTATLKRVLQDADPDVLLAALEAVEAQPADGLIGSVAALVDDPRVGWRAARTLTAFGARAGDVVRDLVAKVVAAEHPPRFAFLLPAIAADIPERGFDLLQQLIGAADPQLRHVAVRVFCDASRRNPGATDRPVIDGLIDAEVRRARRILAARESLRHSAAELAFAALHDEFALHVDAVLRLLQVRVPELEPTALLDPLLDGDRRAEAVELLDNLLPSAWKRPVLSLVEPMQGSAASVEETLRSLLLDDASSVWITIAAMHNAATLELDSLAGLIREVPARRTSPYVAETAAAALATLDAAAKVRHTEGGPIIMHAGKGAR